MQPRDEIRSAITSELERAVRHHDFTVHSSRMEGALCRVRVEIGGDDRARGLDESMEGADAWWPGEPSGRADVLTVDPAEHEIILRFMQGPCPRDGRQLRIYPPIFLEPLQRLWSDAGWAAESIAWLKRLQDGPTMDDGPRLDPVRFPKLRRRQRESFDLLRWNCSFLWGPPGTGKTTTLGALLATFLMTNPSSRVLLLSSTNGAVDQALVSVDKSLEEAGQRVSVDSLRSRCRRIGNHFLASHYAARKHLLPQADEKTMAQLMELERQRPEAADIHAYAIWKGKMETLRGRFRRESLASMGRDCLLAMTTTRATFGADDLKSLGRFDLVVFDEASQVSLAHALALLPLGRRALFTGDPQQLSPIVASRHPFAAKWLGGSPFEHMPTGSGATCFLDEQSRMAEPICELISKAYYRGRLVVADSARRDVGWQAMRQVRATASLPAKNRVLMDTTAEAKFWRDYAGWIRIETAQQVARWTGELLRDERPEDILIVTPFRAQRAVICRALREHGIRRVSVSTAHRAQGSERRTVIFDPVQGDCEFLRNGDAERLINVALSRAMVRLIVVMSQKDRENPLLGQIAALMELEFRPTADPAAAGPRMGEPLVGLVRQPGWPDCAVGRTVWFRRLSAKVLGISDDRRYLLITDLEAGRRGELPLAMVESDARPQ